MPNNPPKHASGPRSKSSPKPPRLAPRMAPRYDPQRGDAPPEMIPLVEAGWILKALAAVFAAALLCSYLTLCAVFSHGQWQLVLHPSHAVDATPASLNLPFTEVHFGVDATGLPQLDGWWIPASTPTGAPTPRTTLILHAASGSMSDALPAAQLLHAQNLNVLLFDYRGYGHSLTPSPDRHPTEASMQTDAATALTYLTSTRSLPASSIAVYATGLGAPLAVQLCAQNPTLPALILQSPDGDLTGRIRHDPRAKLIPFSILFNEPFPLASPLSTLPTPKLTLTTPPDPTILTQFLTAHLPPTPTPPREAAVRAVP